MRAAIVSVLLVCLSAQCGLKLGIVAWWRVNQNAIARTLCENRDKPQLKCCGRCYLKKQLRKAEDRSETPGKSMPEKIGKEEPAVIVPIANWQPMPAPRRSVPQFATVSYGILSGIPAVPFHPPQG